MSPLCTCAVTLPSIIAQCALSECKYAQPSSDNSAACITFNMATRLTRLQKRKLDQATIGTWYDCTKRETLNANRVEKNRVLQMLCREASVHPALIKCTAEHPAAHDLVHRTQRHAKPPPRSCKQAHRTSTNAARFGLAPADGSLDLVNSVSQMGATTYLVPTTHKADPLNANSARMGVRWTGRQQCRAQLHKRCQTQRSSAVHVLRLETSHEARNSWILALKHGFCQERQHALCSRRLRSRAKT
jgi:hypothetical protein